ncbi:MAG: CocE/NonD family hydrolase [Elainellaceae cyanobacterium]
MYTRDRVRLDADVYYPDQNGEFPVLLMRQPYGRAIASTVVYAHPSWYAAHGYIVVIQDVRGRGTSEGEFSLFAHEVEDGFDAVQWAADLLQSNGQVGMYGFSYQGMTQLYAAASRPKALKTICPSMVAYDLYQDWAYEGGAFRYQLNLGWAIQLAAETARRQGNSEAYQALYAASRNLPLHDPVCVRSGLLKQLAPESHYHAWLDHPKPNDYWDNLSPKLHLQEIDLPMLHIGGWFDTYLQGTIKLYKAMATRSQLPQHLIVGPWAHLPWGHKVGSVDYGAEANSPIDRLQIRWFDHFLKGQDTGLLEDPAVCLFEMGSNQWRRFDRYPQEPPKSYVLITGGLASVDDREGGLTTTLPHLPLPALPDTLVHDPWRPVPALGGHSAFPAGAFERSAIDCRTDVLTYTSASLIEDLHLAGDLSAQLYCAADALSFDLCVVLSEVQPNGSVYNISQGYIRVENPRQVAQRARSNNEFSVSDAPDDPADPFSAALPSLLQASGASTRIIIPLQPVCIRIARGSALRLSISASCFPAYAVNAGNGDPSGESRLVDAQVITVALFSEGDRLSQVWLPVTA